MKTLLVAINTKFIHSAYGIYCIKAYCEANGENVEIAEYTINNNDNYIMQDIYKRKPDLIGFSCYIWNIEAIVCLVKNIKKVLPSTMIFLGGPEVSYDGEKLLKDNKEIDIIVLGEGEERVYKLIKNRKDEIDGLIYREGGSIVIKQPVDYLDLDKLPFVYDHIDINKLNNKIIYYESSRGCPYRCSYCLSSIDKRVRFVSIERVLKELKFFLDNKIKQVKFIDRTFNCDKTRTKKIWEFLISNDNGITNFHFEISVDILDDEALYLLKSVRPGLFQFEIGVQTTNERTLEIINRSMSFNIVKKNVGLIKRYGNIHQHLDLIAGLPEENFESFKNSFNDVYRLKPEHLQLGFLKVLKGTQIRSDAKKYGLVYKEEAPYEILYSKDISYEETLKLKNVEEILELYYNSGNYKNSIKYYEHIYETPFDFYEALAQYWAEKGYFACNHTEEDMYKYLLDISKKERLNGEFLKNLVKFDMYLNKRLNKIPEWLDISQTVKNKENIYKFYKSQENIEKYLPEYLAFDYKQISRMTHIEYFDYDVIDYNNNGNVKKENTVVLFNYKNKNKIIRLKETELSKDN